MLSTKEFLSKLCFNENEKEKLGLMEIPVAARISALVSQGFEFGQEDLSQIEEFIRNTPEHFRLEKIDRFNIFEAVFTENPVAAGDLVEKREEGWLNPFHKVKESVQLLLTRGRNTNPANFSFPNTFLERLEFLRAKSSFDLGCTQSLSY